MPRAVDITGQKFGRLTAQFPFYEKGRRMWVCICECGNPVKQSAGMLRYGTSQSCGCLAAEKTGERSVTHNESDARIYMLWAGMKARCQNPKHSAWKNYGGRGIKVCDEWQAFEAFRDWALANGYTDNLTIDRKDNDGNYEPDNCQWLTKSDNSKKRFHRDL